MIENQRIAGLTPVVDLLSTFPNASQRRSEYHEVELMHNDQLGNSPNFPSIE
jgi:hypothetical protein